MLAVYDNRSGALAPQDGAQGVTKDTVWIDLFNPTPDEEATVEQALHIDVPTREEQREIEASSRLYQKNGTYFMTATVLLNSDLPEPKNAQVTFILSGQRLITVRYVQPRAFSIFEARCQRGEARQVTGGAVFIELIGIIVDRLADFIEKVQGEVDELSHSIFGIKGGPRSRKPRYDVLLRSVGREGEITRLARESTYSLGRLLTFLTLAVAERNVDKDIRDRVETATRDAQSLSDHVSFLSGHISFLLDATLGMIDIQQNDIIKILSVAAVVFLPPTLIGTIYGMNFQDMPELKWVAGYPMALVLMVLSALLSYLYCRHRGWM
jgi:magnesium transporter